MKKKMGLFLIAVALTATALVTEPAVAKPGPSCNAPACFRTPGCCQDSDCATYCAGREPGSDPYCQGECCECAIVL